MSIKIGLDRIIIRNIFLIGVDIKTLKENLEVEDKKFGRLSLSEGNKGYKTTDLVTGQEIYIQELFINIENVVGRYILEFNFGFRYGDFQISIGFNAPRLEHETNEKNLNDINIIEDIPNRLESLLADKGIYIDIEEAKIADMEINANIYNNKFAYTFDLLVAILNNDGKKAFMVKLNELESIKVKLSDRVMKAYDKAKEMLDNGEIPSSLDLGRIEVNTKHIANLERILGKERKLTDLAKNFDKIEKFYLNTIEKNIKVPLEKYIIETEEKLFQELENGAKPSDVFEKYTDIATKNNLILDIELFKNAVKRHYKVNKKGSPTSVIKAQLNRKKRQGINIDRLEGNIKRLKDFFKEIGL